ncbi:hypothetical protein BG004_005974 [Podila humilis]|nr:hypothetical protein BG004_005974 [Podila humilis]
MPPSTLSVTIVGGGIGGLALANMLEKAQIDYVVIEKAVTIKALGSSLGLDASSLPVMDQLGLLDDFIKVSKPVRQFNFYNQDLNSTGTVDFSSMTEITYTSSVVIGADGAHSIVREAMYKELEANGQLSFNDSEPLSFDQHCLVGVTEPLDPAQHPTLKRPCCDFEIVIPKTDPFYSIYMDLPGNRVSWSVIHNVPRSTTLSVEARLTEWGPDASMEMANFVRHQQSPFRGLSLGDIIDKTPKELISKVMLEEKCFETWHSGRIVLLGDACHKVVPSAALGANLAILDGVHLCNLLVDAPYDTPKVIQLIFENYYQKRHKIAEAALANARQFGKVMSGRGVIAEMVRKVFLNYVPDWLTRWSNAQRLQFRPQLHFLQQVPDRGSSKARPQEPRLIFEHHHHQQHRRQIGEHAQAQAIAEKG